MKLVDLQSRDVYALYEIGLKDLKKLVLCCNMVHIDFDGTVKAETEAAAYFTDEFFPQIKNTLIEIEKQYGTASDEKTE